MHFTKCTITTCEKALKDAEVTKYDIGDGLSVGRDDVMPKVQETVQQLFTQVPSNSANLDEDVDIYRSSHADRILNWLVMSHILFS